MPTHGREPVGRYDLHELVRQYAYERLRESGEEAVIRGRHAHALLAFAETVEGHLLARQTPLWLDRLEQERDNLRAALNWALEPAVGDAVTERIALGLRLASATVVFWLTRGYDQEGLGRFQALLARPEAATLPYGRMEALTWRAYFLWEQGQLLEAQAALDDAFAINQTIGDKKYLALGLTCQGHVANAQGDSVKARLLLEQGLVLWREQKAGYWIAEVLGVLGDIALREQAYEQAETFYTEGVAVGSNGGDDLAHPYLFRRLAYLALQRDDFAKALELAQASLRLNQAIVTRQGVTACLIALASVARGQGQFIRAARLFGAVETFLRSLAAPLYATDRHEYERNVTTLRIQLNPTDLAGAWAAGQAMTAEQAVAYALADEQV
jgi:tetratricopeptide (TPR) repeat protein